MILVRLRALGPTAAWPQQRPLEPRIGTLGRLWTRKMALPDEVAAQTLPAASNETMGWMYGVLGGVGWIPVTGVVLSAVFGNAELAAASVAATGAMTWWSAVDLPRRAFRKLHERPVRTDEMDSLMSTVTIPGVPPAIGKAAEGILRRMGMEGYLPSSPTMDPLDRSFLALVRDMARLESVPESTQVELREALRELGEAASRLPPETALNVTEAADLLGDAESLLARAHQETDEVVAASLRRQAEALLRSAEAQQRTQVLNRRARILRQELQAQMDALRSSLPTLTAAQAGGDIPRAASAGGPFVGLAQTVHGIADEAASVAAAREELDRFTSLPGSRSGSDTYEASRRASTAAASDEETATLRTGRRPNG